MNIGKRIVRLREANDWSQRELAKRVDLNVSVMNRIESGERPVRDHELLAIASALDVTADYLIGRNENAELINYKNKKEKNNDSIQYNGRDVDLTELTPDQRMLIDWAISRESLSFNDKPEDILELIDLIRNLKPYFDEIEKKDKS